MNNDSNRCHPLLCKGFFLKMKIDIFDTTLRDGFQQEGISPSVKDKLAIARLIDELGVQFIEGGWPGASPKEEEFFQKAKTELDLVNAKLVSFGSTRKLNMTAENDPQVKALVSSETEYVCIVGKSSKLHITKALEASIEEAIDMAVDTINYLKSQGKKVFFDAEHFFDGFKEDKEVSYKILDAVIKEGIDCFIFCDTNGGTLPSEVTAILAEVVERFPKQKFGVHFQNDNGCAVQNSMAAVDLGIDHVQGTMNGYGERTGNADLCTLIPNLTLKMNHQTVSKDSLEKLTPIANHIAELVNISIDSRHPYVGSAAFTHKAGLHASGMAKDDSLYEHIDSSKVGNYTRTTVSELAGRASVITKAKEFGLDFSNEEAKALIERVQDLEHKGFQFEAADGSLCLLMNSIKGNNPNFFAFESYRVFSERRNSEQVVSEAVCKVEVKGTRYVTTGEGVGPVDALSKALISSLEKDFPDVERIKLVDYKVRIIDSTDGTEATTRVLIEWTDGDMSWSTIGVHQNIINASWNALCDGFNFFFMVNK